MKPPIVLLGHGSQNSKSHDEFSLLRDQVHRLEPDREFFTAYLQLCEPDLYSVINKLVERQVTEVIIVPVFLFAGNHIQVDIPALIAKTKIQFPRLEIKLGRHLGPDPGIAALIAHRVNEIEYRHNFLTNPAEIESLSFQMIEIELARFHNHWAPGEREVVKRVIHTTADPEIAKLLDFHPQAVSAGIKAIRDGVRIITDVRMSLIGIGNKPTSRFGCPIECHIDSPEVVTLAAETGKTRAMSAILEACSGVKHGIVVIGNAPTALFQLCEMIETGAAAPDLIIGTPVGFVGAAESKEVLKGLGIPYIRTIGPRGGSPIAAAIVNALYRLAESAV